MSRIPDVRTWKANVEVDGSTVTYAVLAPTRFLALLNLRYSAPQTLGRRVRLSPWRGREVAPTLTYPEVARRV